MIEKLTNQKVVISIIVAYMIFTFALPIRRVIHSWQASDHTIWSSMQQFHIYIPLLLWIPMFIISAKPNSRFAKWSDKAANIKTWVIICYIAIISCVTLTLTKAPGLWWTWQTVGLLLTGTILTAYLAKEKLRPSEALILGLGCTSLAIGVWEVIYQIGLHFKNDNFGLGLDNLFSILKFMFPFILAGSVIILNYAITYRSKLFHFTCKFWCFLILFIATMIVWFANGMWLDIYIAYDEAYNASWYYTIPFDPLMLAIYRSSKVFLALAFAGLVWFKRQNGKVLA